eukprot:g47218.t1
MNFGRCQHSRRRCFLTCALTSPLLPGFPIMKGLRAVRGFLQSTVCPVDGQLAGIVVRYTRDGPAPPPSAARQAGGPSLREFLRTVPENGARSGRGEEELPAPYLSGPGVSVSGRRVYFETYGCQMNVSDTEIAWSILQQNGYVKSSSCTENKTVNDDQSYVNVKIDGVPQFMREKAEQTIWNRLKQLASLKSKRTTSQVPLKIGILGCMAEGLKEEILEKEKLVDVLAGPDSYRDLPRLLTVAEAGQKAVNVLLSLDETYADVMPVQVDAKTKSAFISVMRGCNNMCSYCIVPFTRGRERSRPISSILKEVKMLSDQVSRIDPEMRIRFTSPHPKDFPDE